MPPGFFMGGMPFQSEIKMAGHGGKRAGAGRKPGGANRATIEMGRTLSEMARELAPDALQVLAHIMRSGKTETARLAAANALLDRGYGRPFQAEAPPPEGADAKPVAPVFEVAEPVRDVRVTRAPDA